LTHIRKFSKESLTVIDRTWQFIRTSYEALLANERTAIMAKRLTGVNQELEIQAEELQETTEELQEQNIELEAQQREVK